MTEERHNEIYVIIYEQVEDCAQFWRLSENDKTKYFFGPELIDGIVWSITSIVIPLIVGVSSNYFADKLIKRSNSHLHENKFEILYEIKKQIKLIEKKEKNEAKVIQELEYYFMKHGLPIKKAKKKAVEITKLLSEYFSNE